MEIIVVSMIADFSMQPENKDSNDHCDSDQLDHLILKPTYYKRKTPSTIDLIIANYKRHFLKSDLCETGLSDHHRMVYLLSRKTFAKAKPKTIFHR